MRRYLAVQSDVVGPVFSRIWDTPDSTITQRLKHLFEPTLSHEYVTAIEGAPRIIVSDAVDGIVGGTQRVTYGLNNRFLYRARPRDGASGHSAEFLTVTLQQTYYSQASARRFDPRYNTSSSGRVGSFSPMALTVRAAPGSRLQSSTRFEYNLGEGLLQSVTSTATATLGLSSVSTSYSRVQTSRLTKPQGALSASTALSFMQNRVRGNYSMYWDLARNVVISQTVSGTYMAQCCGIQADFQKYSYPQTSANFPIPHDKRFNVSFVLAGLGTFSNFFGLMGQQP
jgi:hypothetical protein